MTSEPTGKCHHRFETRYSGIYKYLKCVKCGEMRSAVEN